MGANETIWAQMKHIKTHNVKFTLKELEKLTHEAFTEITPQWWKSVIRHVKDKVEDHYWEVDGLLRIITEEFTIQLEEDSDSDSGSYSDSGSDSESCSSSDESDG